MAQQNNTPVKLTVSNYFNKTSVSDYLSKTLGEKKGEFISNVIALSDSDSNIANCDPGDLMKCAMNATALNLPLNKNLGYAYIIAYGSKPQFQIGYKGFIQLAIRSGQYKTINACEVREGEIRRNKFTGEIIFNGEYPENEVVGYLAYIEMLNGFQQSLYMTTQQINEHAQKFSKTYRSSNSVWKTEFDSMAKKTVIKLLLGKYGVLSTEIEKAIVSDQTINGEYADNPRNGRSRSSEEAIVVQDEPEEPAANGKEVSLKDL